MSFAGNLEDLAIVDVIQLLHSTRKSGTLCVTGDKGRSQIVFNQGFIVSANHYNDAIRIGKILVEMEAIDEKVLEETLAEQKAAEVEEKQPLIGMLIEKQAIERDIAYKGLECLIEMTIVEMVSWQKGTFTLDVDVCSINDEYRYIPEKLQQDLNFDTQMVLMDALRIYDEKRAAGEEFGADFPPEEEEAALREEAAEGAGLAAGPELSADILGLDDIDRIEVQVPQTFTSLEAFDPSEIHRQKVREILPDFPAVQREDLVSYLAEKGNIADSHDSDHDRNLAILLYGHDELVRHGLMTSCKHNGIMVFTAGTAQELESRIIQSLDRGLQPILVFDCPSAAFEGFSKDEISALRQQTALRYPRLQLVQIASPLDYVYSLQALTSGATTVIPRSLAENRRDSFIGDFIQFLESFPPFIQRLSAQQAPLEPPKATFLGQLQKMRSASEIAFFLLEQTSQYFERCLTLVVRQDELQAERSFGIEADKAAGPSAPLRFKISLEEDCLLSRVIASRTPFFDAVDDRHLREAIFGEISAPDKSKILLLPLVAADRTLGLIYADFGQAPIRKVDEHYLGSLAWIAGLALEQILKARGKAG